MSRAISLTLFTVVWEGVFFLLFIASAKDGNFMVLPFLLAFLATGGILISFTYREWRRIYQVKKNGEYHDGIIISHVHDNTMASNGDSMVALRVRYYSEDGAVKEVIVPTGSFDRSSFPMGSCISFMVSEQTGECLYISKAEKFPNADLLLDADLEYSNNLSARRSVVSCTCPNCGATLIVSNRKDCRCKFCGQIVPYIEKDQTSQGTRKYLN